MRNLSAVRYKKVMEMRESGMTFQEIAEDFGVSRQRIWQIAQRAHKRISGQTSKSNHVMTSQKAA